MCIIVAKKRDVKVLLEMKVSGDICLPNPSVDSRPRVKNEKQNHFQTKITESVWHQHKNSKGQGTECTSGRRKV